MGSPQSPFSFIREADLRTQNKQSEVVSAQKLRLTLSKLTGRESREANDIIKNERRNENDMTTYPASLGKRRSHISLITITLEIGERMKSQLFARMTGFISLAILLGGCGGGGSGSQNPGQNGGTGPVGYGTCVTVTASGAPSSCTAYVGSVYKSNVTIASTGCSGTGQTLSTAQSGCSLTNSVGTCTIAFGAAGVDATAATTLYSTGGWDAAGAKSNCTGLGTYTNP